VSKLVPNGDVFINCPFDPGFSDIFRAIVFAVRACGFQPRCAMDESDGSVVRIDKIQNLIEQCDWSIHDLSAVELDAHTAMPRFNMPLELGIALGAKRFGGPRQRIKRLLILERDAHRYDKSTSDLSGQDIAVHGGKPDDAIRAVRNWLADNRAPGVTAPPGGDALANDYIEVRKQIDGVSKQLRFNPWASMTHGDFLYCLDAALQLLSESID
jgi:hypothetical protein